MPSKTFTLDNLHDEGFLHGNNAAFRCPVSGCGKVFIATTLTNKRDIKCPKCDRSSVTLKAEGGQGTKVLEALIEWD